MQARPFELIKQDKFAAYTVSSIEMRFFEIDDSQEGFKQSSEPLIENNDNILAVSSNQIFIFKKTLKGLYPRITGTTEKIEFDSEGFFSKVYANSEDFGLIKEEFVIEWPKKLSFLSWRPNDKSYISLSVKGKQQYFEPKITQKWLLGNCSYLGSIALVAQ